MKSNSKILFSLLIFALFFASCSHTQSDSESILGSLPLNYDPLIKISIRKESDQNDLNKIELSLSKMRNRLKVKSFTVAEHPAYNGKKMTYLGFEFAEVAQLIRTELHVKNDEDLVYSVWANDNFSAFITSDDLKSGHAFLAFQEVNPDPRLVTEDKLWSAVEKHGNPGPFYLVWNNPKTTYWQKWPFKIAEFTLVSSSVTKKFERLAPGNDFMQTKGYRLVLKNCTACHMIKQTGFGQMGPDLDLLYMTRSEKDFIKQIRTPKGKMVAFSKDQLSGDDIAAIRSYLDFISKIK